MATMGNWNGHTFEVSPNLIRGFTELSIKGSCETTTKNSKKQKYVERKYGEIPEISLTVGLSALTGVTDVYSEALAFVKEATQGATAYFYLGSTKLLPAKAMLTSAEVVEIVNAPGQGDKWLSCNVKLTLKQGSKTDEGSGSSGSSGSSGGGGSKKKSVKTTGVTTKAPLLKTMTQADVQAALNSVTTSTRKAKEASAGKVTGYTLQSAMDAAGIKQTKSSGNTAVKKNATTGRITNRGTEMRR